MTLPTSPHQSFLIVLSLVVLLTTGPSMAQSIVEQKETVAFVFGTVHLKDPQGHPAAIEMALGTGFFVSYPDTRGGPDFGFFYFVTAKHVLRDIDGSFLSSVRLRLNLKSSAADPGFDFINVPVTDKNGNLLWFHTDNDADDVVAFPLLPDQKKFAFKAIPFAIFVNDATLKTNAVEEGDNLYFIGLMAQYYGFKQNYPVVRRGTLALMTNEKIKTETGEQRAFIAELQSWPGNSGSPVFLNLGGLRGSVLYAGQRLSFLGILAGTFLNQISGTLVTGAQVAAGDKAEIGVSYIVPAMRLADVLQSSAAQQNRDFQIGHFVKSSQSPPK